MLVSLLYMGLGFNSYERQLPRMELATDFMFATGMFAVLAGLSMIYQTAGIILLGYDTTLSFVFIGVGMLGTSVYFWSKQQIVRGIPIGWEIFTSAMVGIVFVSLFILPTGQVLVPNPFEQYVPFQIYVIASIPLVWSVVGAQAVHTIRAKFP